MGKVGSKDGLSSISKLGKGLGLSYFSEGSEEGVENLVCSRYEKGDYDNGEGYCLLSGGGNMGNVGLEGKLGQYGIDGDNSVNRDKDVMNEMKIGGFSGLFMRGVYGGRDVYEGSKEVLRENKVRGVSGDDYGDGERDKKIDEFMWGCKQNGNKFGRIGKCLE